MEQVVICFELTSNSQTVRGVPILNHIDRIKKYVFHKWNFVFSETTKKSIDLESVSNGVCVSGIKM
jgi:hypothetical protein